MKKSILILLFSITIFACEHLSLGVPLKSNQVVCRDGYAIGYNYTRKASDWIAYRLIPDDFGDVERQEDFREDEDIPKMYQMLESDYDEPVYDLGHLVSSESQSKTIQMNSETFILSNVAPQLPGFNRAGWKGLENRERKWTQIDEELYIFIGMLYEGDDIQYLNNKMPIATHFYKIMYSPNKKRVIAYLFPHKDIKTKDIDKYLVSVDNIETRSGFDFLSELDDHEENHLEGNVAKKQWKKNK